MHLLTDKNHKILKSREFGYETFILHLAPAWLSGFNVCSHHTAGCSAACLNTAGRGIYARTQNARIRRTKLFFEARDEFFALLIADIYSGIRQAKSHGLVPCFRLNGTSDIPWERIKVPRHTCTLFTLFPDTQFYDYSAIPLRVTSPNYHLTFSRKESNDEDVQMELARGMNVAIVFQTIPEFWNGHRVISGDKNDLRFLDPNDVIVGLSAKGKAKRDKSGFVIR